MSEEDSTDQKVLHGWEDRMFTIGLTDVCGIA